MCEDRNFPLLKNIEILELSTSWKIQFSGTHPSAPNFFLSLLASVS